MKVGRVLICALLVLGNFQFLVPTAKAIVSNAIIISQVKAGDKTSPRLVELYNNSDEPVDITGWCVRYVAAAEPVPNPSTAVSSVRACFNSGAVNEHLILPSRAYILVGSDQLGIQADFTMAEGLGTGSKGKVYVTNAQNSVIDVFGWGDTTVYAEGTPKSYGGDNGTVYERYQSSPGVFVDTNNNSLDFFNPSSRTTYEIGSIVEVDDVCQNLPEIQVLVPDGFILSSEGQCLQEQVDLCDNIDGVQLVLPLDTEVDDENNCYEDACTNLPGFQDVAPAGFQANSQRVCSLGLLPLQVTELLPNPDGDDKNNEFIELYNPNDTVVDLTYYVFHLGGDYTKIYSFPVGSIIEPRGYLVIFNKDVSFTLTNTWNSLRLRALDNTQLFDVPGYSDAESGQSWALINNTWQYTNNPTPGAANKVSSVDETSAVSMLTDCGEGRERNPLTNRCRNIATVASAVKLCKDGQYRSEETNRCRNISAASGSKPCKDNQYRSEETNRCRNVPASSVPDAAFAVQPIKDTGMAFVGWWALGGIGLLAVGYALWEWRHEVTSWMKLVFKR